MLNKEQQYFLYIVKNVITGGKQTNIPSDFDWDSFFELTKKHSLTSLVAYGLKDMGIKDERIERFKQELILSAIKDSMVDAEMNKIFEEFEKNNIDYLPLKGFVIKNIYPSPETRSMADVDLLIRPADAKKTDDIMKSFSYLVRFSNVEEDAYTKEPFYSIELHKKIIGDGYPKFTKYYKNGWSFAKRIDDTNRHELSCEDFYIFHMVHLAKHYNSGGSGVRSIVDIFLFLKNKHIDRTYVARELKKLGLLTFAKNMEKLAFYWFGEGETNEVIDEIEEYIFKSGTYGTIDNYKELRKLKYKGIRKIRYYLTLIFPSIKDMSSIYPVLKRNSLLLPIMWIVRLFRGVLFKRKIFVKAIKNVPIANNGKSRLEEHMSKIGL